MFSSLFNWFEAQVEPFPAQEPDLPPRGLMPFLWHYTRPLWPLLLIIAVLAALIAVQEILLFSFLGTLVDLISTSDRVNFWDQYKVRLLLMGVVVLITLPLSIFIWSLFYHQSILGNFPMIVRWQAHRYLLGQSFRFYQDEFAGRIATKVMQTALAVRECVTKVLDILVYVSVYFLGMIVLTALADWRLSIPLLLWLAGYVGLLYYFIPRLRDVSERQADSRAHMTGQIVDSYTNILTLKLFSHESREAEYVQAGMGGFLKTVYDQMRLVTGLESLLNLLNCVMIFIIGAIGITLWMDRNVSAGAIAVALGLALRLNGMSQWIMWEMAALFENIGTVKDGINTLAHQRSVEDKPAAHVLPKVQGNIVFDHVQFHYGQLSTRTPKRYNLKQPHGVLHDIDLTIQPGEKVGLVGRSGAGKSTLINLLLRLYDLESGSIHIDGHDISSVTQASLRAQISVVTQDTSLLHRSVRDNILYGRPDASEDDMIRAAKQAAAYDFIQDLRDKQGRTGFDAHVGERGVKLSGGQRQRIAIARVFLKDAPILILDEATSALDSEVEAAIQEQLFNLMQGKTVIAIAHRLSTIASLDRLVVMDEGHIIETGAHEELIHADGLYAKLWQHQSGGFLGEVNPEALNVN